MGPKDIPYGWRPGARPGDPRRDDRGYESFRVGGESYRGPYDWHRDSWFGRPRGPKGYRRSDERVLDEVCERIGRSGLDASEVEVAVEDGEVTLSGTVRDRREKWHLEDLAEGVFGVSDVHNRLRIDRGDRDRSGAEGSAVRH